ncbi:hypothetical protein SCP_0116710 [Sparassis crispa]|uniref:HMG box domain-containing protein n=1 Tax=Sparassis crispa TaxID=139825 RepID=A0A401G9E6_9APHY|nr:hypothetical protein SCP_0116710 [Sparassis crispa]GBE78778.1 hypothetical protein SCP_0116710 [Sparassis crispa]
MSRYHPSAHYSPSGDPAYERQQHRIEPTRHDPGSSQVNPAYPEYTQGIQDDVDIPDAEVEDPHLALTSQTLNADGTPKRPMNAFMIYARRRRPQISAANQMMRTGDISKILSKEWSSMDMSDKKFYLDQAKKLKENFNNKYPDYVYRRRPNNSRKKRKPDPGQTTPPSLSPGVEGEDGSMDEGSPTEGDDRMMSSMGQGYQYSPPGTASSSAAYEPHDDFAHSSSPYAQSLSEVPSSQFSQPSRSHLASIPSPADNSFVQGGMTGLRLSTLSAPSAGGMPGLRLSTLPPPSPSSQNYPSPSTVQPSHASPYTSSPAQMSHNPWDSPREAGRSEQGRPGWPVLPALDMSAARQRPTSGPSDRPEMYSPPLTHRSWSSTTASTPSSGSASGASGHYSNSAFPTLTPAFFPSQSPSSHRHTSSTDSYTSATAHPGHPSPPDYAPSSSGPAMHRGLSYPGRSQSGAPESAGFTHTTTLPTPTSSAYLSAGQSHGGQWPSQYRVPSGSQRVSPPMLHQPSSAQSPASSSSGASPHSASHSHMSYWDRSRYDGR